MKGFVAILLVLVTACAGGPRKKKLTQKEIDKLHIMQLQKIRPLLVSDDFPYMNCESVGKAEVMKKAFPDMEFWQRFGLLELREKGLEVKANIMTLKHTEISGKHKFAAEFFNCERVQDVKLVGPIGMCKPTQERLFTVKYGIDESRKVGEEIVRQVIRHHGISKYYKTYSVGDIKYSFTKKEIQASAKFFECF